MASLACARASVFFQGAARLPGPPPGFGQMIVGGKLRANGNGNEERNGEQCCERYRAYEKRPAEQSATPRRESPRGPQAVTVMPKNPG